MAKTTGRRSFPTAFAGPPTGTGPRSRSRRNTRAGTSGSTLTASTTQSTVWVNGTQVGTTRGAFIRGKFDISEHVTAGKKAVIAVLVAPQPHPGEPHEHTLRAGMGQNGGITAIDGPTFLSTIGWDWLPAIRDRDTGIWQKVYLSATGPVLVKDPLVTTDLPLPRIDSSDVGVQATVENVTDQPQKGVLQGTIENITFEQDVEIAPHSTQKVTFDAQNTPALHIDHPRLWWPNGYGPQNLYKLHLSFEENNAAFRRAGCHLRHPQDHLLGARFREPDDLCQWRAGVHSRRQLGAR